MFDLKNAILPVPVEIEDREKKICLGEKTKGKINIFTKGSGDVFCEAVKYLRNTVWDNFLSDDGEYKISLIIDSEDTRLEKAAKKDGYIIDISEKETILCGYDEGGAYYAAVSFKRLIHSVGDEVYLPICFIRDYPHFEKRGHYHECRYGSDFMTLEDWKKAVDYFADMKVNTLTLGIYGCWDVQYDAKRTEFLLIPFEKYPQLKTPRDIKYYSAKERKWIYKHDVLPEMFKSDYLGELIKYAKTKNIELFPLFNSFGHNTLLPRLFPEISAVNEKGEHEGVGFCTSNEGTYKLLFELYDEIIDKYLKPNGIKSIEVGLDEIWKLIGCNPDDLWEERSPFCQCEKCKQREFTDLLLDFIIRIVKYLKSRGMENIYMYQDMLCELGMLNEDMANRLKEEGIWENVVIDWWNYSWDIKHMFRDKERFEIKGLFRNISKPMTGYFHWALPTQRNINIKVMTEEAVKSGFEGMLAYGAFEYCYDFNYWYLAECAWNPDKTDIDEITDRYAGMFFGDCGGNISEAIKSMNEIMIDDNDDNIAEIEYDYYRCSYLFRDKPFPQDYPGAMLRKTRDEEKYYNYLHDTYFKAKGVYETFDANTSSALGDMWKLSAAGYMQICNEFMTLYRLNCDYNKGYIDEFKFMEALDELIESRDKVMLLAEEVRIKANSYVFLRDMSVIRQAICDLRLFIEKEIKAGRKPDIDVMNFKQYLSNLSWFIR